MFRSLASVDYRIWFVGALISNIGAWMQATAQSWVVLTELTDNDGWALLINLTTEAGHDELAAEFRSRIEMRQIGVRDDARMLSGYGSCGRHLCCASWLQSFEPVSIKMAKQQDLSLNPSKLSGLCGRLKCCLRYELPEGKLPKRNEARDEALRNEE